MKPPPVEALVDRAGSRYAAAVLVATRAKQLSAGAQRLVETEARDAVAVALDELASGQLHAEEPVERPEASGGRLGRQSRKIA